MPDCPTCPLIAELQATRDRAHEEWIAADRRLVRLRAEKPRTEEAGKQLKSCVLAASIALSRARVTFDVCSTALQTAPRTSAPTT